MAISELILDGYDREAKCFQMGSPVQEFYREKSIFITGGTGFIGKVLCEKLLRSCPDIGNIYLLLRKRKDKSAEQRLQEELLKSPVFSLNNNDLKLEKIIAINGDISLPGLGISDEDRDTLTSNVSVVFHSAASVKFHGPLKEFVGQNVDGTQGVMQLANKMTKLESVVYVSTAYANCGLDEIEESVYKLKRSASQTIKLVKALEYDEFGNELDKAALEDIMEGRPNAYTISKAIAESLVAEKYGDLPVVIVRPSIVTPSLKEPAPGWVDNVNGVAGALLLGALGIARTMDVHCDAKADLIPVDIICNSLIVIGWYNGSHPNERKKVIHLTTGQSNPVTWGKFLDYSRDAAQNAPSRRMVRPLAKNPTSARGPLGRINHLFVKYVSHILFAFLVDTILFLSGNKRLMVKLTQKMHRAFTVLEHFTTKEWHFHDENFFKIYDQLSEEDQKTYYSDVRKIDWEKYAQGVYWGTRRYLLNEDDSTVTEAKKRLSFITICYTLFQIILATLIAFLIYSLFLS